ncbi:MAG TPA: hypothetical protein VGQ57_07405, partial [Polyangiaceae bacterium]|nr:hypothetical protein [Polyangiaceae bacterium]
MRRSRALYPCLVAAVALVAFGVVVTFGFAYDDAWTIVENHWLERPLVEVLFLLASGEGVARHFPDATRPVMVLGHWLERRVYGLSPWGYHLDSLLLYALVGALATHVAWLWCRRRDVALFAGCFFTLAPLQAEVVASINYREDLYAALGTFVVLALLFRPTRTAFGRIPPRRYDSGARALAIAAAFLFALLGKESALSIVPLALVAAYCLPAAAESLRSSRRAGIAAGGALVLWLTWRVPLFVHGHDLPLAPQRGLGQMLLRTARFEVLAVRNALFPWFWSPDHWRQIDASFSWFVPFLSLVAAVVVLGKGPGTRLPALGLGVALVAPLGACPLLRP